MFRLFKRKKRPAPTQAPIPGFEIQMSECQHKDNIEHAAVEQHKQAARARAVASAKVSDVTVHTLAPASETFAVCFYNLRPVIVDGKPLIGLSRADAQAKAQAYSQANHIGTRLLKEAK